MREKERERREGGRVGGWERGRQRPSLANSVNLPGERETERRRKQEKRKVAEVGSGDTEVSSAPQTRYVFGAIMLVHNSQMLVAWLWL
jgi:hypothetical protein